MNLVVMPGSPALVRELAPGDQAGARLLTALREVFAEILAKPRRIELVGSRNRRWHTGLAGSFRAWGAPQVTVGAGHHLPELVQRYALGDQARAVTTTRDDLGQPDPDVLTIVAVDGSAGLDARAPLAELPGAAATDRWCRAMLAGTPGRGECTIEQLTASGVLEPELWAQLAALTPVTAELVDADTTLGVGRYVAGWEI